MQIGERPGPAPVATSPDVPRAVPPRPLAPAVAAVLRALGAGGPELDAAGATPVLGHGVPVGWVEALVGR